MAKGGEHEEERSRPRRSELIRKPMRRSEAAANLEEIFARSYDQSLKAAHVSFLSDVADRTYDLEPILKSVFAQIGSRWGLQLIVSFGAGPHRFSTLLKILSPISKQILTQNLRNLERDGFLERITDEKSFRVQYHLTGLGRGMLDLIMNSIVWMTNNAHAIKAARVDFDRRYF